MPQLEGYQQDGAADGVRPAAPQQDDAVRIRHTVGHHRDHADGAAVRPGLRQHPARAAWSSGTPFGVETINLSSPAGTTTWRTSSSVWRATWSTATARSWSPGRLLQVPRSSWPRGPPPGFPNLAITITVNAFLWTRRSRTRRSGAAAGTPTAAATPQPVLPPARRRRRHRDGLPTPRRHVHGQRHADADTHAHADREYGTVSARRLLFSPYRSSLLAAGIAMAVAGGPASTTATGLRHYGSCAGQQPPWPTPSTATTAQSPPAAPLDPAKQEPVLDKFVSKDPFQPLELSPRPRRRPLPRPRRPRRSTPTATPTSTPTPTPTSNAENPTSAAVIGLRHQYTVTSGSKVPSSSPVFTIARITTAGVTFKLLNNMRFEDGSTSVQVAEGQTVSVTNRRHRPHLHAQGHPAHLRRPAAARAVQPCATATSSSC